jgi:hypothetical protein
MRLSLPIQKMLATDYLTRTINQEPHPLPRLRGGGTKFLFPLRKPTVYTQVF